MLYDISTPTTLMDILDRIELSHWRDTTRLNELQNLRITSSYEAKKVCVVISDYMSTHTDPLRFDSPLPVLLALLSPAQNEGATNTLRQHGLPLLRELIRQSIDEGKGDPNYVMGALELLARHQQAQDMAMVARLAHDVFNPDRSLWFAVFQLYVNSELSLQMVDALRDLGSHQLILIAYLDVVNKIAREGMLKDHPFDTEDGIQLLRSWLTCEDKDAYFAHSAAATLPFVSELHRAPLVELALEHSNVQVKLEAAWALAEIGEENGVNVLRFYTLAPQYSLIAQRYLNELDLYNKIPDKVCEPTFQATAILADWLAEQSDLRHPPDKMVVINHRQLFWPPTHDEREFWLIRFVYDEGVGGEYTEGVGFVGSGIYAMNGGRTMGFTAEEFYGFCCAWELGYANNKETINLQQSMDYGKAILAKHNEGF